MVSFTVGLSHAEYTYLSKRAERENKKVNQILQELVEEQMKKEEVK
jgi:hypothetical protein